MLCSAIVSLTVPLLLRGVVAAPERRDGQGDEGEHENADRQEHDEEDEDRPSIAACRCKREARVEVPPAVVDVLGVDVRVADDEVSGPVDKVEH